MTDEEWNVLFEEVKGLSRESGKQYEREIRRLTWIMRVSAVIWIVACVLIALAFWR
jgi:hypothetical protein